MASCRSVRLCWERQTYAGDRRGAFCHGRSLGSAPCFRSNTRPTPPPRRKRSKEQATQRTVGSTTTLLGVVKHLAWVERWWFGDFIGGRSFDYPWSDEDPDADWRIEDDETVESVSALYAEAVAEAKQRASK